MSLKLFGDILGDHMNVLFVLDHPKTAGGGHVQGLNYFKIYQNIFASMDNIKLYYLDDTTLSGDALKEFGAIPIKVNFLKLRLKISELAYKVLFAGFAEELVQFLGASLESTLKKYRIDLIVFLGPSRVITLAGNLNYVVSSWDLSHREDCEFPEVRSHKVYFTRELWIQTFYNRAICIIVDSDYSKRQMSSWYGIDPNKIIPIPFQANNKLVNVPSDNDINQISDFKNILVPSQFWSHKGHVWIIEAIQHLKNNGYENLRIDFVGGDRDGLAVKLQNFVRFLNLEDCIKFNGFVADAELSQFYANADILLFASYFGPTNIPPLEGALHGIPVVMPKKESFLQFYGKEFYYFDITEPTSLSSLLATLLNTCPSVDYTQFLSKLHAERTNGILNLTAALRNYQQKKKLWSYDVDIK